MAGERVPRLAELPGLSKATLRDRWHRLRANWLLALQTGVAAGSSWFVAHTVIGHPQAFFAPIAAVITLSVSVGQRFRRAAELVAGVALGIAIGDVLIYFIGTGSAQIGLVVALAVLAAVFVGGTSALLTQSASSAVLVATLAPPTSGVYYPRFLDALVGGVIALIVIALVLPMNPLMLVRKAANPALETLAAGLSACAAALAARDRNGVQAALNGLDIADAQLSRFADALASARETVTVAPLRWRARGPLNQYLEAAEDLTRAVRDARLLIRRAGTLLRDEEPLPAELSAALQTLSEAVRDLRAELADAREPGESREKALAGVRAAATAYADGVGFSGSVVVAQVRSVAHDLLRASGLPRERVENLVRKAGRPAQPARL